jgi:hypothetical protein
MRGGKKGKRKHSSKHFKLEVLENAFIETQTNEKMLYHAKRKHLCKERICFAEREHQRARLVSGGTKSSVLLNKEQENFTFVNHTKISILCKCINIMLPLPSSKLWVTWRVVGWLSSNARIKKIYLCNNIKNANVMYYFKKSSKISWSLCNVT